MILNYERIAENNCCIGCGACEKTFPSACNVELDTKGYYKLSVHGGDIDDRLFSTICPVVNNNYISSEMWGNILEAKLGWSSDNEFRFEGSSGGVVSALAAYLLDNCVDGILHVKACKDDPIHNELSISRTKKELLDGTGSRYAPVKTVGCIDDLIEKNEKYALIGKPCDIRAFLNLKRRFPEEYENIIYTISFFCAGTPCLGATNEVLDALKVKAEELIRFDYRGRGWPGYTTAVTADGRQERMTYNDSWGKILGRSLFPACRFCADGVGVEADIACGDAWYCDENGYPIFEEQDGRNIILVRSERGKDLLAKASVSNYVTVEDIEDTLAFLKETQPYQYKRKAMMLTKLSVLRLAGKYTPVYPRALREWGKQIPSVEKIKYAYGTVSRIIKKKIK